MRRQQLLGRIEYDNDDRQDILDKTDYRCAHCGKQLNAFSEMEIDHFIPISKGGFNQKLNLYPLCPRCNDRKRNKIVAPDWYLQYAKPEYKNQIQDYFDSYLRSFDAITRGNLLLCDLYELKIYMGPEIRNKKKQKKQIQEKLSKKFVLERLYPDELEEAEEFFTKYLEKYQELENREQVRKNLEFWIKFGTIYCIRDAHSNEMKTLVPITIQEDYEDQTYVLVIYIFSLYASNLSGFIASILPDFLARHLCREQKLPYIDVAILTVPKDPVSKIMGMDHFDHLSRTLRTYFNPNGSDTNEPFDTEQNQHPFYQKMKDVKPYLDAFFAKDGYESIQWMGGNVIRDYTLEN